jgi:hypothetical protein
MLIQYSYSYYFSPINTTFKKSHKNPSSLTKVRGEMEYENFRTLFFSRWFECCPPPCCRFFLIFEFLHDPYTQIHNFKNLLRRSKLDLYNDLCKTMLESLDYDENRVQTFFLKIRVNGLKNPRVA